MNQFDKICMDIKDVKIQGAENIAKAAVIALKYNNSQQAVKKLISLRPTEPALVNAIRYAQKYSVTEALQHLNSIQDSINKSVFLLIKNNSTVYTHCHSSTVTKALIYAKQHGKRFEVHNTETRPLFQGRKTALELANSGIKVCHFVDSAMELAIKDANIILLGADSITKNFVYNKIGSELLAETAYKHKVPLYICTDSWKFDRTGKETEIEQRSYKEIWKEKPNNVHIHNPAFEQIPKEQVTAIISELGILKYKEFLKRVK